MPGPRPDLDKVTAAVTPELAAESQYSTGTSSPLTGLLQIWQAGFCSRLPVAGLPDRRWPGEGRAQARGGGSFVLTGKSASATNINVRINFTCNICVIFTLKKMKGWGLLLCPGLIY